MARSIKELVVFMASPSDVADERAAVRGVAEELNALFADRDIRFRIVGWEHTLPAAGRPQGLINPGVEQCDVFIGLLNRRWGSATGDYSSGFEEEYTLAQSRHDQRGAPTIHLFFAEVPTSLLEDPGPSLKKVIEFKAKIITEHTALFRTYEDRQDLARQVQTVLTARALEVLDELGPAVATGTSAAEEPSASSVPAVELDEAREQMAHVLQSITRIIRGEGGEMYDQDRLELIARAFGKDRSELGAHFVNRLFRRRDELVLSVGEAQLWLRTMLADIGRCDHDARTIPGWDALLTDPKRGGEELVELAASDLVAVPIGAIRVLAEHDLRPARLFGEGGILTETEMAAAAQRWVAILNAQPGISEALDYFLGSNDLNGGLAEAVVQAAELNQNTTELLTAAKAAQSGDPNQLASTFGVTMLALAGNAQLRRILIDHVDELSDDAIVELVRRGDGNDLRARVLAIGLRRGLLDAKQAEKAVDWENDAVVAEVVDLALESPDIAEVLLGGAKNAGHQRLQSELWARSRTHEDLLAAYKLSPWNTELWTALLLNASPDELAEARELIDNEAADLRELLRPQLSDREDLVDFIVEQQIGAAGLELARGLRSTANKEETSRTADLARIVAAERPSNRMQRSAVIRELAGGVRTESAAEMAIVEGWLQQVSGDLFNNERKLAFEGPLAATMARIASTSDDATLRTAARQWRAGQATTDDDELLELIYDDESQVRMAAIHSLVNRWDRPRLAGLLNTYSEHDRPYWYNIIVALDDHLHAPGSREVAGAPVASSDG